MKNPGPARAFPDRGQAFRAVGPSLSSLQGRGASSGQDRPLYRADLAGRLPPIDAVSKSDPVKLDPLLLAALAGVNARPPGRAIGRCQTRPSQTLVTMLWAMARAGRDSPDPINVWPAGSAEPVSRPLLPWRLAMASASGLFKPGDRESIRRTGPADARLPGPLSACGQGRHGCCLCLAVGHPVAIPGGDATRLAGVDQVADFLRCGSESHPGCLAGSGQEALHQGVVTAPRPISTGAFPAWQTELGKDDFLFVVVGTGAGAGSSESPLRGALATGATIQGWWASSASRESGPIAAAAPAAPAPVAPAAAAPGSWCSRPGASIQGADGQGVLKSVRGLPQAWRCSAGTRSRQAPKHAVVNPTQRNSGRCAGL